LELSISAIILAVSPMV